MDLARHDFSRIAEEHGTPFYLYDLDEATTHLQALQSGLPDHVDVLYCMKANPNRHIVNAYSKLTPGLDISSGGEMELALANGWEAERMSFAGPGKTDAELEYAIQHNIGSLSIESVSELKRAAAVAERLGTKVNVLLRVNPASIPKEFAMKMGGGPSQFGIPEEEIDEAVPIAKSLRSVNLRGFHVFSGTQCLKLESSLANIRQTLQLAARLAEEHDLSPEEVNLGGGVGIAYFPGQADVSASEFAEAVNKLIQSFRLETPRLSSSRLVLEMGRYLIGRYGVYVARVTEIKETRGKRFAILDGGMNHCFPATGNFGQLVKKNYPVSNLTNQGDGDESMKHEIVGPLCTPLDSMARSLELPKADVGDLVAFNNCGAYSYSASPLLFLSHKTPLELLVHQGELTVARRRMSALDFC